MDKIYLYSQCILSVQAKLAQGNICVRAATVQEG